MGSTKEFIEKAKKIHGGRYDYSKAEYVSATDRLCIICPEHGEFWQTPQVHLRGGNCPECASRAIRRKNTKSTEDFITDSRKIHGDRYDYSKAEYAGNSVRLCIICPEHGEFWQTPQVHLRGGKCPECVRKARSMTGDEFINKARAVHGDKYDYSKVRYVNAHTDIVVTCPKHGDFTAKPSNHLNGSGCPGCKKERIGDLKRKTVEDFINEANEIHNKKYDYANVDYRNTESQVIITCPIHGDFVQRPQDHLRGHGCPKCANQQSLVEEEVYEHISSSIGKENVLRRANYILGNRREIDIYVPSLKFGIEYNGLHWHTEEFGKDRFSHLRKTEEAMSSGISLIQIFEDEWVRNKDIVLSKIDHMLGIGKDLPRIFGRKCTVKPIDGNEAEPFLEKNHIQGFVGSSVYIGAYYNDYLVGVASFTEEKSKRWNLTRMATCNKYVCDGVCGKMLSYFKRTYEWDEIKTFADRRWTLKKDNNLYTKLGFVLSDTTKPDYRYVVGKERIHKFRFRKNILARKYGLSTDLTEREMASKLGFHRIWDCGLYKYVMKNGA